MLEEGHQSSDMLSGSEVQENFRRSGTKKESGDLRQT